LLHVGEVIEDMPGLFIINVGQFEGFAGNNQGQIQA
jgi:hypothetical protein